jgi:hypothetical protein
MAELVSLLSIVPHMRFSTFDVPPTSAPALAGAFFAARIILVRLRGRGLGHNARLGMAPHALNVLPENADCRRAMQKAPSRMTGPFGRSSVGRECSLTPPISQFVTLSFGSKGRPSSPARAVGHRRKLAPITSEQVDQMGSGCCSSYLGGPPTSRGEADREGIIGPYHSFGWAEFAAYDPGVTA